MKCQLRIIGAILLAIGTMGVFLTLIDPYKLSNILQSFGIKNSFEIAYKVKSALEPLKLFIVLVLIGGIFLSVFAKE